MLAVHVTAPNGAGKGAEMVMLRSFLPVIGLLAWLVPLLPVRLLAGELERFEPKDVFELEWASDPRFTPDGGRVIYMRNSMDVMTDRRRSSVWTVDLDGSRHRPLLSGEARYASPRLSSDGRRLLYVSDAEGSPQLYVMWMDTRQTARLTHLTRAPSNPAWSPDGKWIAFTQFVPRERQPMVQLPPPPEGAKWAPRPREIQSVRYRRDGQGLLEEGSVQLFLLDDDGGTPRQLTRGEYNSGPPVWLPESTAILISSNRSPGWEYEPRESEIHEVSLTGEIRTLTDRKGPDSDPAVSPDGRTIAYTGYDDRGLSYANRVLYVMDRNGEDPRPLTRGLDRSVSSPQWHPDGEGIYVMYGDEGSTRVALAGLDGKIHPVVTDAGGLSLGRPYGAGAYRAGRDGVVYTSSSTRSPPDVGFAPAEGEPRRLTRLNQDVLTHKALGPVEPITYASPVDGRPIDGWIIKPPDFDPSGEYPLILEIHGGPYAYYGPYFSVELQLMASAGYVVLYTNPRGSTGYGAEFANLIHQNYPSQDYDDLIAGVDHVLGRGYVDPENLFVTGGSGGGVLTAWIVGKTDRFRAAVASKPVINWVSISGTSDIYVTFSKYWMPAPVWEEFETYWKYSPLSLVGNVTTPTMLLTGELDLRTPISETEQYYQALKLRKVDTAMVRIPGAAHGIAQRPSHLVAKVAYILAWFEKYRGHAGEDRGANRP